MLKSLWQLMCLGTWYTVNKLSKELSKECNLSGHKWYTTHRVLKSHKIKMSIIHMQSWKQCALLVITTMALWPIYIHIYIYFIYIYIHIHYIYLYIYIHIHTKCSSTPPSRCIMEVSTNDVALMSFVLIWASFWLVEYSI